MPRAHLQCACVYTVTSLCFHLSPLVHDPSLGILLLRSKPQIKTTPCNTCLWGPVLPISMSKHLDPLLPWLPCRQHAGDQVPFSDCGLHLASAAAQGVHGAASSVEASKSCQQVGHPHLRLLTCHLLTFLLTFLAPPDSNPPDIPDIASAAIS